MSVPSQLPVIIIGAGIVGLALSQSLKREGIPFRIYERDSHLHARASGWGISIDWNHPTLKYFLAPSLFQEIASVQVDHRQKLRDTGTVFLDLETGEPRFLIPSNFRRRVNRGKLRELLSRGIDIQWNKSVSTFQRSQDGILVTFTDGTQVEGSVLAAADGSGSTVRQLLVGDELGRLNQLPVAKLSVTLRLSEDKVNQLRATDDILFQGCHPDTGCYMFYSTFSTPEGNGSADTEYPYFESQLDLSWIVRGPEDTVPATNTDRLAKIKHFATAGTGFYQTLRDIVLSIPQDAQALQIALADWPTIRWHSFDGRVTLLGDAAHPMAMYRGEAANHGFTDVGNFVKQLKLWNEGAISRKEAVANYETEVVKRGREAVLLNRQACLDAHDIRRMGSDSPMINRG